jgi:flavin-binding protein dodecin
LANQTRQGSGKNGGENMAVARVTQIVASSQKSFDDAIKEGLKRANKTLRGLTGLEVTKMNAKIEKGKIMEYRAHLNITFILEE